MSDRQPTGNLRNFARRPAFYLLALLATYLRLTPQMRKGEAMNRLAPAQTRALIWLINHPEGFISQTRVFNHHYCQLSTFKIRVYRKLHWNTFAALVARKLVDMYATGQPFSIDWDETIPWYESRWRINEDGKAAVGYFGIEAATIRGGGRPFRKSPAQRPIRRGQYGWFTERPDLPVHYVRKGWEVAACETVLAATYTPDPSQKKCSDCLKKAPV